MPRCEHCNDTGLIARSTSFPCGYRGPGPVPEYAKGVYEASCDQCRPEADQDDN